MKHYRNDPRAMDARYTGTCAASGKPIRKGDRIVYWPKTKRVVLWDEGGESEYLRFLSDAHSEEGLAY